MFENTPFDIRDERQLKALTGLPSALIQTLELSFCEAGQERRPAAYKAAADAGKRVRKPGGGRKGALKTAVRKIVFLLYYLKSCPTFDEPGAIFGMSRSKACENARKLRPSLYEALPRLSFIPHREFESVEAFRKAFAGIEKIMIDVTERETRRPADDEKQRESYSGKKKKNTVKNTAAGTPDKALRFIGATMPGRRHDYAMLKEEFSPDKPWFAEIETLFDLGYTGVLKDYDGSKAQVPHRKPRKSKDNPNPRLSEEQRERNRTIGKFRVLIENAFAGLKRYNVLVHAFRTGKDKFIDDVIALCAGLRDMLLGVRV